MSLLCGTGSAPSNSSAVAITPHKNVLTVSGMKLILPVFFQNYQPISVFTPPAHSYFTAISTVGGSY